MTAVIDGDRRRDFSGISEKGLIVPAIYEAKSTCRSRIVKFRKQLLRKQKELYLEFW